MGERKHNASRKERMHQLETIVTEHETALLRYATRIVRDGHTAQDVVQGVFIKLFSSWQNKGFPEMVALRSWLYRVTHNAAVDHIRAESRRRNLHEKGTEAAVAIEGDRARSARQFKDRKTAVLHHLRLLAPAEQQVVALRLEEGLSYREIAEITGRTEGNVGCLLHHAVKKLSKALQVDGESVPVPSPVAHESIGGAS